MQTSYTLYDEELVATEWRRPQKRPASLELISIAWCRPAEVGGGADAQDGRGDGGRSVQLGAAC